MEVEETMEVEALGSSAQLKEAREGELVAVAFDGTLPSNGREMGGGS